MNKIHIKDSVAKMLYHNNVELSQALRETRRVLALATTNSLTLEQLDLLSHIAAQLSEMDRRSFTEDYIPFLTAEQPVTGLSETVAVDLGMRVVLGEINI